MKHSTHMLSMLLLAALLLSACGETSTSGEAERTSSDTGTTAPAEMAYPGDLPDYGGVTFTVLNEANNFWTGAHNGIDFEEQTGDPYSDAVYERNRTAEDELNIVIEEQIAALADMRGMMDKAVMAGEYAYDAVYLALNWSGTSFGSDSVINLREIDTISFDQPWWNQKFIKEATIDGVLYTSIDYVCLMSYCYANVIAFNRQMVTDLGMEQPYDLVREGNWTYSTFASYVKAAANIGTQESWAPSVSGDAIYGFACQHDEGSLTLLQGIGEYLVSSSGDELVFEESPVRLIDAVEQLNTILGEDGHCVMVNSPNTDAGQGIGHFLSGRAMFYQSTIGAADSAKFRESNVEYGLLPPPKLDESQSEYYTPLGKYTMALNIPKSVEDAERVGQIVDYLSFLSYRDVIPELQTVLCYKGLRDDDSIEMLNLMLETLTIDIGVCVGITTDFMREICNSLTTGSATFASTFDSLKESMKGKMNDLLGQD